MRRAAPLLLLAALALQACASVPAAPGANGRKVRPLASYAEDPFVPVNVYFNANEHLDGRHAALVEYAAQRLTASGAFVRMDRGLQRWPITLQVRYRLEPGGSGGDTARRVLGALTLGLVPVRVTQVHTLAVEIFEEPESVASFQLTLPAADRVSLYALADADRDERAAVDALLERLLAEIAHRKAIPRWSEFKPEPKKEEKKKPEGRPT